jgi:hypothetical protein
MAKTLTTKVLLKIVGTYLDSTALDTAQGTISYIFQPTDMASGTAASQADVLWADKRTLDATSETLDLAGMLEDAYQDTATFANVRAIYIGNKSTTSGEVLTIGGATASAWAGWVGDSSDTIPIGPSGCHLLYSPIDGYAVTATTGDLLKVDAGTATITYEIIIIGTST